MRNIYQAIKNLLKREDGPVFVSDGNEMKYVVMTYDKYQKMASGSTGYNDYMDFDITDLSGDEMLQTINRKITQWKDAQEDEEDICLGRHDEFDEIKVEDIPF